MRVLLSGATGLIGSRLSARLQRTGYEVVALTRNEYLPGQACITWSPATGRIDPVQLEGFDAIIHLAGAGIAERRWSDRRKAEILNSRVKGTRMIAEAIETLQPPPTVLVSASGKDFYGDRGDTVLTEESPRGDGFLSDVCVAWENATVPAAARGTRVVLLRTAMVLAPEGGALQRMLLPFRLGAGGRFGSGAQWWSWIAIDDAVESIAFVLANPLLAGPVNICSPNPVTNAEFTRILAKVLGRPAVMPAPRWALRMVLGEMADPLLFHSTRLEPLKLRSTGFQFGESMLEPALRKLLQTGPSTKLSQGLTGL